jgi:hypothetical protein
VPSLARIDGSWLADVDATLLFGDTARLIGADESETEVAAPPFLNLDGTPMTGVTPPPGGRLVSLPRS